MSTSTVTISDTGYFYWPGYNRFILVKRSASGPITKNLWGFLNSGYMDGWKSEHFIYPSPTGLLNTHIVRYVGTGNEIKYYVLFVSQHNIIFDTLTVLLVTLITIVPNKKKVRCVNEYMHSIFWKFGFYMFKVIYILLCINKPLIIRLEIHILPSLNNSNAKLPIDTADIVR